MGIRLVKYGVNNGTGTYYHDELSNRDLPDQHPISAITDLEDKLKQIDLDIQNINEIEKVTETNTLKLEYDKEKKSLTGNVKIYESSDDSNAIVETSKGLYVSKTTTKDTNTIEWVVETKGESLSEIYNNGIVFSHNGSWSNVANSSEANSWYWDNNLQSFVQPQNTVSFTGFVTENLYDNYYHTATLTSSNSDDDLNGLIVGFVFDDDNRPHTLSIVCDSGGVNLRWALIYDYALPDQQVLFTSGNGANGTIPSGRKSSWSNNYITIHVTKHKNIVTCTCTNWNSSVFNENTKISIDLNNYSWGYLFKSNVRYGYCNHSQAYSYFRNISFNSRNSANSQILFASVKISSEAGNKIIEKEDGIYCKSNDDENANSNILKVQQDGHKLSIGNVVYLKEDGLYDKAFGEDSNRIEVIGIITKVIDENNFVITVSGEFKTDIYNSYKNGDVLYLSNSNLGELTNVMQTYIKPIGIKIKDGILINVQRSNIYGLGDEDKPEIEYYTEEEILELIESLW